MKQRRRSASPASNQLALNFDVFTVETPKGIVAAAGDNALDAGIRQILVQTLDAAFTKGLSRERVADGMTTILGRQITKAQIDLWVAPSQADRRIPVDALVALMETCQDCTPLEWISTRFSRKLLTADEALCAEFGAMAVLDRHFRAKQREIEGQMDEKLLEQLLRRLKKSARL